MVGRTQRSICVGVAAVDEVRQRDAGREQRGEQPAARRPPRASPRSSTRASSASPPPPPTASGSDSPIRPSSAARACSARGSSPARSQSSWWGSTSRSHEPAHRLAQRLPLRCVKRVGHAQQRLRDVDVRASAATRRAPWPAGRGGRWTRRPRRAGPRRRSSPRAGWAAGGASTVSGRRLGQQVAGTRSTVSASASQRHGSSRARPDARRWPSRPCRRCGRRRSCRAARRVGSSASGVGSGGASTSCRASDCRWPARCRCGCRRPARRRAGTSAAST